MPTPTTRKYPNTMQDAYPNTVDHYRRLEAQESIHGPFRAARADRVVMVVCVFALGFVLGLLCR